MTHYPVGQRRSQWDQALQILVASLYERKWKDDKNVGFCLSLQGSRAEPLPVSFLEDFPFGIIGLAISVLDFTGASRKLEAILKRYVAYEKEYAQDSRKLLLTTDAGFHWKAFLGFLPALGLSLIAFVIGWWFYREGAAGIWISDVIVASPLWLLIAAGISSVFLLYALNHILSYSLSYVTSVMLWFPFWVLSRPRAGIVGSCGLLMALADNLIA